MVRLLVIFAFISPAAVAGQSLLPRAGLTIIRDGDRQNRSRQKGTTAQRVSDNGQANGIPIDPLERQNEDVVLASLLIEESPFHAGIIIRHLKAQGNAEWERLYNILSSVSPHQSLEIPYPKFTPHPKHSARRNAEFERKFYASANNEFIDSYYQALANARMTGNKAFEERARIEGVEREKKEREQKQAEENKRRAEQEAQQQLRIVALQEARKAELEGLEGIKLSLKVLEQHKKVLEEMKGIVFSHPIYKEKFDLVVNPTDVLPIGKDKEPDFNRLTFHIVYKMKPSYQTDVNSDILFVLKSALTALTAMGYEPDKDKTPITVVALMTERRGDELYGATFGEALYVDGRITPESIMYGNGDSWPYY